MENLGIKIYIYIRTVEIDSIVGEYKIEEYKIN